MREVTRTCVSCRSSQDRQGLLRVGRHSGRIVVDVDHSAGGRGVYMCKTAECVEKAFDSRLVERGLKVLAQPGPALVLREEALRYVVAAASSPM